MTFYSNTQLWSTSGTIVFPTRIKEHIPNSEHCIIYTPFGDRVVHPRELFDSELSACKARVAHLTLYLDIAKTAVQRLSGENSVAAEYPPHENSTQF